MINFTFVVCECRLHGDWGSILLVAYVRDDTLSILRNAETAVLRGLFDSDDLLQLCHGIGG